MGWNYVLSFQRSSSVFSAKGDNKGNIEATSVSFLSKTSPSTLRFKMRLRDVIMGPDGHAHYFVVLCVYVCAHVC